MTHLNKSVTKMRGDSGAQLTAEPLLNPPGK